MAIKLFFIGGIPLPSMTAPLPQPKVGILKKATEMLEQLFRLNFTNLFEMFFSE